MLELGGDFKEAFGFLLFLFWDLEIFLLNLKVGGFLVKRLHV